MTNYVVLNKNDHLNVRIISERSEKFGDSYMAAATFPEEFPHLHHNYPIIFRRLLEEDEFQCLALLGLREGENLFLDTPDFVPPKMPLSFEVIPFMIGRASPDANEGSVIFDPKHRRVASNKKSGSRLFDEDGNETEFLQNIKQQLKTVARAEDRSKGFVQAMRDYELLESLNAELRFADGSIENLTGFYGINGQRLKRLGAKALKTLQDKGFLVPCILAHASLARIGDLIDRRNRLTSSSRDG